MLIKVCRTFCQARVIFGIACVLVLIGFWKGLRGSGTDFRVFYAAAKLASQGYAELMYREGPDRFLYAPGFAYLLVPLALLPYSVAHPLWLFGCVAALFFSMRLLARKISSEGGAGVLAVSIAVLFLMRPIWIDLRYGQVNLLILAASVWMLVSSSFLSGVVFAIAAFAKIYPLPLFLVPLFFLRTKEGRKKFKPLFLGSLTGFLALLFLPTVFSDAPTATLYSEWFRGLVGRGFPLETHNQSLLAFLHRVFSGEIIRSHQTGGDPMRLAGELLSSQAIRTLFGMAILAIAFFFIRAAKECARRGRALAIGLCIALCFLPAHLIWKPYFLLGVPLAAAVFAAIAREENSKKRSAEMWIFAVLFALSHFSSAEIIGRPLAAWYEAFSGFLWVHVGLVGLGFFLNGSLPSSSHSKSK